MCRIRYWERTAKQNASFNLRATDGVEDRFTSSVTFVSALSDPFWV
jgi:hypothetical protein